MHLKPARLRRGEVVSAASAVVLLVALWALPWFRFGARGGHTDAAGFSSLPLLRWFLVITGVGGILLALFQAGSRAPAMPVAADLVVTILAALTTLLLVIRLPTSDGSPLSGAFIGLLAVAGVTVGAFMALRQEDGWVPDAQRPVERASVGPAHHPS
jgi:hypothetical protein